MAKKSMKKAMKKAMKTMKKAMKKAKKSTMKRKKKAKRVSKIAKGKRAKIAVFKGKKERGDRVVFLFLFFLFESRRGRGAKPRWKVSNIRFITGK